MYFVAECNCAAAGSHNNICNRTDGQCPCFQNVEGRTCSNCKENTWGYGNETGCKECGCFEDGSLNQQCNLVSY